MTKSSPFFKKYLVTSKQSGRFFQIFVAFSEYRNFIAQIGQKKTELPVFEYLLGLCMYVCWIWSYENFLQYPI